MKKLQLTPAASITENKEGVLLQSDLGAFQLHGRDVSTFISDIAPLLQGKHDLDAICQQLSEYENESIHSVIDMLMEQGLIEEISEQSFTPPWPAHERFLKAWANRSVSQNKAPATEAAIEQSSSVEKLQANRVLVIGLEPWAVKMVDELATAGVAHIHIMDSEQITSEDLLFHRGYGKASLGLNRAEALKKVLAKDNHWCDITYESLVTDNMDQRFTPQRQEDWDLVIVTLGAEAQFFLKSISEYIQEKGYTALYGAVDGLESWVGPVVKPGETACWNCLRLRRLGAAENTALSHVLDNSSFENKQARRARSMLSPMAALNGQQLAMEALTLLLQYRPSNLYNQIRIQNLITGQSDQHRIIPMPWCEVCGGPCSNDTSSNTLKNNPLNQLTDIDDLKKLLEGWVDPVTGIIRKLTGHIPSLPDYPMTASANVSSFTEGTYDVRNQGQIGSGKGLDILSAHISAVGEAIERYSAARFDMKQLKYANISQLIGDYLDPEHTVLYSKKQYQAEGFPFSPWKRKQKIHWTKGTWLGTEKPVWVPALLSYFNFNCPHEEQFSQVSSNGLAAGQTPEDAGVRACYELIERDAMMLTWYAQLPCQRLKLDTEYDGKMRLLIDDITRRGVELELYLLDVGLHVPTVVCLAFGDGIYTPAVSVALSCHGDIKVAMRKALLEQGHVMPYLCYLMSTQSQRPQFSHEVRSLEDHAAFYFNKDKAGIFDFMRQPLEKAILPDQWQYSAIKNAQDLKARLDEAGIEIAIVDVTSPDVALSPFKVARAIGPHLQPIHFGEQFRRFDNPRLRRLLKGRPINPNPHPIA